MTKKMHVLSQHQDLNYAMDRIALMVSAPEGTLTRERTKAILEREFRDFRENVNAHFSYEETDGYMADVLLQAPQLSTKIDALLADHVAIGVQLEGIKSLSYEDGSLEDFCQRIAEVVSAVKAHEQSEQAVLQEFIVDELGSGQA